MKEGIESPHRKYSSEDKYSLEHVLTEKSILKNNR